MTATTTAPRELTPWEVDRLAWHRDICADSPAGLAEIDQTEAAWRTLPAPGPCPPWCTAPDGHGYVDDDPRAEFGRYHSVNFTAGEGLNWHVSQFEQVTPAGDITLLTPDVLLPEQTGLERPDQVFELGIAAIDAARMLRQIREGMTKNALPDGGVR